jgi:hypothetical protein
MVLLCVMCVVCCVLLYYHCHRVKPICSLNNNNNKRNATILKVRITYPVTKYGLDDRFSFTTKILSCLYAK